MTKIFCKCGCGQQREETDSQGKKRLFINGHQNRGKNNGMYGVKGEEHHTFGTHWTDEKRRENQRQRMKNLVWTEEMRRNISIALTGRKKGPLSVKEKEALDKLHKSNTGRHHTQEYKQNSRESRLGNGTITYNGYRNLSFYGKRIYEHKYVWMKHHNYMPIPKGWCIHHINGNKLDNRIENLACIPLDYHTKLHYELDKLKEQQEQVTDFG